MWKVKNVATDRKYEHLRRHTPKLEIEPIVNGQRLKLGSSVVITDADKSRNWEYFAALVKAGVLIFECIKPFLAEKTAEKQVVETPPSPPVEEVVPPKEEISPAIIPEPVQAEEPELPAKKGGRPKSAK